MRSFHDCLCTISRTLVAITPFVIAAAQSHAQQTDNDPLQHIMLPLSFDTGLVANTSGKRDVAYSAVIQSPHRTWMRLQFDHATLGRTPAGGQPTILRITSLLDGAVQTMNGRHLQEWRNTTAYFNGDTLRIEIISDPAAPPSRLTMRQLIAGPIQPMNEGGIATICNAVDDRVLSNEAGNARILPAGCTGWLISDANHTFLTAGHCGTTGASVAQFNVPLSTPTGGHVNPPPEDQYVADPASIQFTNTGIGNDWCYFGCFPNTNTNLTPFEAQGAFYTIGNAPALGNPAQDIRVTGYGSVDPPVSPTWDSVQKTHNGPYVSLAGATIAYRVDTTGGNSGSPVVNLNTNIAIGIHTNGGCTDGGGQNTGTAIQNNNLQNALANPQGVCIPDPALDFDYPDGLPANVNPAGDAIRVVVTPGNGGTPQPGSGQLHLDTGSGFVTVGLAEVASNTYDAIIPATACGATLRYYFSAQTSEGIVISDPFNAPTGFYNALSAAAVNDTFTDNFQIDTGWTISGNATAGQWQRVVPTATGTRVPPDDADGSGMCYVTGNAQNVNVNGGSTIITSPALDVTGPESRLSYRRWFSTSSSNGADTLRVEVSDDNGASWILLESHTSTATIASGLAWIHKDWPIDQIAGITPTNQFRVRFSATDAGTASTVEGGIDGVQIRWLDCTAGECPADVNNSGGVNVDDLIAVISTWGPCPVPPASCTANIVTTGGSASDVDVDDMLAVITAWGPCR